MSEATTGNDRWQGLIANPRLWLGLALAVIAVAFIVQNRDPVAINLFSLEVAAPQWLTLSVLFGFGLITGLLWGRRQRR